MIVSNLKMIISFIYSYNVKNKLTDIKNSNDTGVQNIQLSQDQVTNLRLPPTKIYIPIIFNSGH